MSRPATQNRKDAERAKKLLDQYAALLAELERAGTSIGVYKDIAALLLRAAAALKSAWDDAAEWELECVEARQAAALLEEERNACAAEIRALAEQVIDNDKAFLQGADQAWEQANALIAEQNTELAALRQDRERLRELAIQWAAEAIKRRAELGYENDPRISPLPAADLRVLARQIHTFDASKPSDDPLFAVAAARIDAALNPAARQAGRTEEGK